jgi:hypothetical protein
MLTCLDKRTCHKAHPWNDEPLGRALNFSPERVQQ